MDKLANILLQQKMIKNSAILFKDVRNLKRNQTTMLNNSISNDIIRSFKELSKVKSTKQININSYVENKNEKIKHIDEKLEVHQEEINKNHTIIEELNHNFLNLKEHLDKEKENTLNQERKNKLLRDEIERTNKILKMKNSKIEECTKKIADLEKQNDNLKLLAAKNQEYSKTINSLRSKAATSQENISDLKHSITEKDHQLSKLKQKMSNYESIRIREQEMNGQLLSKDVLIGNLKMAINELNIEKNREFQQRSNYQSKIQKLLSEISNLNQDKKSLKQKYEASEVKMSHLKSKIESIQTSYKQSLLANKNRQKDEFHLKVELNELRVKYNDLNNLIDQKDKEINKRDVKVEKISQKIKDLEHSLGQNYKQKDKLKSSEEKIQLLKKRLQNLQVLYHTMTPQIQCPFGHELNNPVTIIPCGHNYCLGCKKGYQKQCMQCSGKLKIEAVYRNQLMDDIIGMVGGIKQIIEILK